MTSRPKQVWADSPFELISTPFGSKDLSAGKAHGAQYIAQQMVHLHNCILRLLNSIYNQALHVRSPDDIRDFLAYVNRWHDELLHHHMVEEEFFFPALEALNGQKGSMEGNVAQHDAFEPGLEALGKYAASTGVEEYDGHKLRAIIDSFGEILSKHLADEIPTLLKLEACDDKEVRKVWAETTKFVQKTADFYVQLPMLMSSFDSTWENGQSGDLEVPAPMYYAVEWWFIRRHKNAWKFLPCSTFVHLWPHDINCKLHISLPEKVEAQNSLDDLILLRSSPLNTNFIKITLYLSRMVSLTTAIQTMPFSNVPISPPPMELRDNLLNYGMVDAPDDHRPRSDRPSTWPLAAEPTTPSRIYNHRTHSYDSIITITAGEENSLKRRTLVQALELVVEKSIWKRNKRWICCAGRWLFALGVLAFIVIIIYGIVKAPSLKEGDHDPNKSPAGNSTSSKTPMPLSRPSRAES